MPTIEHHVEVVDLPAWDGRLDPERHAEYLRSFGEDGCELVWLGFDVDLERFGRGHVLVFKRFAP